MKLHNILLTAALFLTAGIASATVIHEDNDNDGIINSTFKTNYSGTSTIYAYVNQGENKMITYHLYNGEGWDIELKEGKNEITKPAGVTSFYVVATSDPIFSGDYKYQHVLVFSAENKVQVLGGSDETFSFQGGTSRMIEFGNESGTIHDTISIVGSPLPTPVVTLLIALGFGAAFVMYRNRKQVKA